MRLISNDNELLEIQPREDLQIDRNTEKKVFEGELSRLGRENVSLKDHLQRALTELRAYQIKYPPALIKSDSLAAEELPPWTTSEDIINPLFEAYDNRISELEKVIETQSEQLEAFHYKVTSIMEENENLRGAQLENLKVGSRPTTFGSLTDDLYAEMSERIEILMSENSLMVDQKTMLSTELEAHQTELAMRTKEVAELSQLLNTNLKDLKSSQQLIAQTETERDEASEKALAYSDSLARAEIAIDELKERLTQSQTKVGELDREAKEARSANKTLVAKVDNDALASMRRMKAAEERISELHSQLLQKTEELDGAQDLVRKLRRECQTTRQDAESMLQVMQGLERQLAAFSEREKEVERIASENKNKMEEVLIARDQVR
jgi:chromosome segregation ATPase